MLRLALTLLLFFACGLQASPLPSPLPSSASGAYLTTMGSCSLVLSRFGADAINVDIACPGTLDLTLIPGHVFCSGACSHTTAFAPAGACIGDAGIAFAFPLNASDPNSLWVAFDRMEGELLYVRWGLSPTQLYDGLGVPDIWSRASSLPSPHPYTCGAPAPPAPVKPAAPPGSLRANCRLNPRAPWCRG